MHKALEISNISQTSLMDAAFPHCPNLNITTLGWSHIGVCWTIKKYVKLDEIQPKLKGIKMEHMTSSNFFVENGIYSNIYGMHMFK